MVPVAGYGLFAEHAEPIPKPVRPRLPPAEKKDMNKPEWEKPRARETDHDPVSPSVQTGFPSHDRWEEPAAFADARPCDADHDPATPGSVRSDRTRLPEPRFRGTTAPSATPLHGIPGAIFRLGALLFALFLARGSDLTLALYQGFLLADFTVWILTLGYDAALRKTLSFLEGTGYLFLFWLFCQLGNGTWLPEEPSLLGMSFLSYLLFFLGKTLWWSHRNFGSE